MILVVKFPAKAQVSNALFILILWTLMRDEEWFEWKMKREKQSSNWGLIVCYGGRRGQQGVCMPV